MNAINVDKVTLLHTLQTNREKHRAIFLEAQAGYRAAVIAELEKSLEDARNGRKIRRSITLIEPMDQTADYDRAIAMIQMSIDPNVLLEERDFMSYVLDDWMWKKQFNHSNYLYSATLQADVSAAPVE